MFGSIGGPELVAILILALLLFGPRKLPEIGRTIGRALAEFRGVTHEFRATLEREVAVDDLRQAERDIRRASRATEEAVRGPAPVPRGALPGPQADEAAGTEPPSVDRERDRERADGAGDEADSTKL